MVNRPAKSDTHCATPGSGAIFSSASSRRPQGARRHLRGAWFQDGAGPHETSQSARYDEPTPGAFSGGSVGKLFCKLARKSRPRALDVRESACRARGRVVGGVMGWAFHITAHWNHLIYDHARRRRRQTYIIITPGIQLHLHLGTKPCACAGRPNRGPAWSRVVKSGQTRPNHSHLLLACWNQQSCFEPETDSVRREGPATPRCCCCCCC